MNIRPSLHALLLYTASLLLGAAAIGFVLPLDMLIGAGPGWNPPGPDQAQSLTGHLAFQADTWRWPLLETARLFWPHGISLTLVDSNPLFSILAKAWTRSTHTAPENWLGAFIGLCWLLQPVAGVYAARGLRLGAAACLAVGIMATAWPALMFRMMHINLCAHFLILLALGLAFRRIDQAASRGWRDWIAPAILLLVAILTHPYLFQLCAVVLAVIPLHAALRRRPGWPMDALFYLGAGVLAVGLLMAISGPLGGGDKGFVFFSMNLASPVWPQLSGVFGANLPIIDATGGQYEGLNWLGAGTMLLLLGAIVWCVATRTRPRPALALILILGGLALLSLSSRIYAGPIKLLDLGAKPWEDIFGSFRAPGRAFWPVGYAILLGLAAIADRMRRPIGYSILAAAVVLQLVDIRPLLARARASWANGSGIAAPAVPLGTTLFTVAPHPGCAPELATKWAAPVMLLDAVRHGARTGDIGLGRSPKWFNCEAIVSDALELPMVLEETRAFFGPEVQAAIRPELMGEGTECRRTQGVVLCGRGVADFEGEPLPARPRAAPLPVPLVIGPAKLPEILGGGWVVGISGQIWSEGPRSTLLIPVKPGQPLKLHIRAAGISFKPGESRIVSIRAGRVDVGTVSLPDGMSIDVTVAIPPSALASGMLRLALDVQRPVDPGRRNLVGPVKRAAIVLSSVTLSND